MDRTGHQEDVSRHFTDEDLQKLKSTVRHMPDRNTNEADAPKKRNSAVGVLIAGITLFVVGAVIMLICLAGNVFKNDPLKGTWDLDGVTGYEFYGKGHGTLILPMNRYEFGYMIEEGELRIDYADPAAEDCNYFYSLSDDELTLISSDGTTFRFSRAG